jgi:hypothetical protein
MAFHIKDTNIRFSEMPSYCGGCPAGVFGNPHYGTAVGYCALFGKRKTYYNYPPKRCRQIIEKGLELSEGETDKELVIVKN